MENVTANSKTQELLSVVLQVLEEYFGNRKAEVLAIKVCEVMKLESQHTHAGKQFFAHADSNGKLVLTTASICKEEIAKILRGELDETEAEECLKELMAEECLKELMEAETKTTGKKVSATEIETILVEGSNRQIYSDMLEYTYKTNKEWRFFFNLEKAIKARVRPFRVMVYDPSIDKNGSLQWMAGCKPAVGYLYDELQELAIKNGLKLGSKNQYILFMATLIHRLKEEGWSIADALNAVCNDSTDLGHYLNSKMAKGHLEPTGLRKIAGKCDLGNTYKILSKDEKTGDFWVAGGHYFRNGFEYPLANLRRSDNYVYRDDSGVGWFVL